MRKEYYKQWRIKNRTRYLKQKRENYQKNKEIIKERMRDYYQRIRKVQRLENPKETKKKDRLVGLKRIIKLKNFIQEMKIEKGGKCERCEYDIEPKILHFHHLNGKQDKVGNISEMKSLKKIRIETVKCILLCPNCHALTHLPK